MDLHSGDPRRAMRSHHGCTICRQRKLKCDEVKPACGQCMKSDRECVFSEDTKFRHFEAQALLERGQERSAREAPERLFARDQVWLEVPAELTFVNIANPFEADEAALLEAEMPTRLHGTGNSGDASPYGWENMLPTPPTHDLDIGGAIDAGLQALPSSDFAANPHESSAVLFTTTQIADIESASAQIRAGTGGSPVGAPSEAVDDDTNLDDVDAESSVLALQLVRHFREGPGQWMDLFDTSAYFSCKVPILASTRPLLKSAICALAAKHLSRVGSRAHGSSRSSFAGTSRAPDWEYHAVRYYHQAIRRLKTSIAAGGNGEEEDENGSDRSGTSGRHTDTFAAVAILCVYELMTAPGNAWKAHLTALPLYSSADEGPSNCSPVRIPSSPVRGPIFWSLARQDFLCALISETQTRLNSDHVRIWQNFGLSTAIDQEPPILLSFSPFSAPDARAPADAAEDTKSNELLWLLGKIVNFITSGDAISSQDYSRPVGQRMSLGITQEILLETWQKLEAELDGWFDGLPPTFTPSARTKVTGGDDDGGDGVEQIWYDVPMCASTMQSYHMARILLLTNRPQESTAIRSTLSARLRSYRHIQREVLRHGREICGISLADPTGPVRIHSVQPLFVAGQSFHESRHQKLVLGLLSDIEEELGWATGYQIRKLTDEWQVE